MANQEGQYLSEDKLLHDIKYVDMKKEELGSTDTYHEDKILNKYLSYKENEQVLIYKAAIQLAIIGYGRKNYGFIRVDDKNVITLIDLFKKLNIKWNEGINAKYVDDELSARRLIRLFRFQIKLFIEKNDRPSYLWTKYANKDKKEFMSICFPGGEHLIKTREEAIFLIDTYRKLDEIQNTKFVDRLRRVFIARNILDPTFFDAKYK